MNFNEKYRCESLDEIKGQDYIVSKLKALVSNIHNRVDDGDCPHLFFSGSPGTGKTNIAIAFLKDAFGKDWHRNFREFNASETRIEDIRKEVIKLAGQSVIGTYKAPNGKEYDIPFNTIFFDEIDYLPPKSQAILRRVIEKYATNTRFILSCNYRFKVIDALISRCMDFHFRKLSSHAIFQILESIVEKEEINIITETLQFLSEHCSGDARKAQNLLQKVSLGNDSLISVSVIEQACNEILTKFNTKLLGMAVNANTSDDETYIKDFKMLDSHINKLYYDKGYTGSQILINIFDSVTEDSKMPIGIKRKILGSIGECMRDCSLVDDDIYTVKMWLRSIK